MASSIVVGWDGSAESAAALDWALDRAQSDGSPVRIVGAVEPVALDRSPRPEHSHETLRAMVAQELAAVREVQALARPALTITTLAVEDAPVDALVGQSRHAALLVLGLRGAGGVLSLTGSTTLGVAARTQCPLVAVPRPEEDAVVGDGVVVGTDGSLVSEGAVAFAFEQASRLGTGLTVVHTWRDPATISVFGTGSVEGRDAESHHGRLLAGLTEWLAPWSSKMMPDVEVATHVSRGNPAIILVDLSRHSQLLVVGTRGGHPDHRGWLGSVSQGVLHLAAIPTAVVPLQH